MVHSHGVSQSRGSVSASPAGVGFASSPAMTANKSVHLIGIPYDLNSSYLLGAAEAPAQIRAALHCESANLWTEDGIALGQHGVIHDGGDLRIPADPEAAFHAIEQGVISALAAKSPLISLGGDHSITYPILSAFHKKFSDLTILHLDAHPDLYDTFEGSRLSHACPFARIMEERLARRLVQVGIRTATRHQREQAERFGVEVIEMRALDKAATLQLEGPLYVSFDMDVLDPAFAPGISHYEPGGMSVREALNIIQNLRVPVVGADIVEFNPLRDRDHQTTMVAAKILKELAAAMLRIP